MAILTEDEKYALHGTHQISELDNYRQLIYLGKLPTLVFLLNAVILNAQTRDANPQSKIVSDIASAVALGNVWELKKQPKHLKLLIEFVEHAQVIDISKKI